MKTRLIDDDVIDELLKLFEKAKRVKKEGGNPWVILKLPLPTPKSVLNLKRIGLSNREIAEYANKTLSTKVTAKDIARILRRFENGV